MIWFDLISCKLANRMSLQDCCTYSTPRLSSLMQAAAGRRLISALLWTIINEWPWWSADAINSNLLSPNSTWLLTSRLNTFDMSSPCILAVSSLSNSTARHARLNALDTSNVYRLVSRREVTSQVEFGLYRRDAAWHIAIGLQLLRLFTYIAADVVTVIKCRGRWHWQQTPCDWRRRCVCPATLVGSYILPELIVSLSGNFSASDASSCIWLWTCVKFSRSEASLHCAGKSNAVNRFWFNSEMSLSLFAVLMRGSAKFCKKSCSKRSKFASQKCYSRCHKIGYIFVLSPPNSILPGAAFQTPLGTLITALTVP